MHGKRTERHQIMVSTHTATTILAMLVCVVSASNAQSPTVAPIVASVVSLNQAIFGEPFGVAKIEFPMSAAVSPDRVEPLEVSNDEGRIFYPVTRDILAAARSALRRDEPPGEQRIGGGRLLRRVGDLVRQATTADDAPLVVSREVWFLFRGNGPLRVRTNVPDQAGRTEFILTPLPGTVADDHAVALNRWWSAYGAAMLKQIDAGDYPPIVENYLVAMLSGRLNLPLPPKFVVDASLSDPSIVSTLELIAGTEKIKSAVFRRTAIGIDLADQTADLPIPPAPNWALASPPLPAVAPELEPMASRVPPECFYIRYGSFENYLWFRDLSEEYGGDIGRMIALRGSDDGATRRVEDQLNLKMTQLSRMLGGSVIEDQAIVGRDLFLSEGASLGVVFRAKNAFLLQTSMNSDRTALAKSDPEIKLTKPKIAGREVSFLHTIDNRIRSYMVNDGEYIFVTNSRELAKRFIEVGQSGVSLATTPEFALARQWMPLTRNDTIFAYFSPAMLRGLMAPEYLIEVRRRLHSAANIGLVRLARLAASSEGEQFDAPEDLMAAGYLPRDFTSSADGSGLLAIGDDIVDSLRGRAGTLLPIADVECKQVTAAERDWYASIASYHESKWPQIDPVFVGLKRQVVSQSPAIERLEIHGEIAPFVADKYGAIAKQLGPPTNVKIDFAPDDIVAGQAHVASDQLGGTIPPHHLFAAIKDSVPPTPEQFDGLLQTYQSLRSLPGYLGAWPQPGLLDRLPLGLGRGQPVGPGMSRLIGGLYRYQGGDFSILSFQSDVLLASLPFLAATQAEDSAQVRLRVGNLDGSQLESWVNDQLYARSAATSRAGGQLLSLLTQQLKVPVDNASDVAGRLIGGKLQDPLGGQYVLAAVAADRGGRSGSTSRSWVSSVAGSARPSQYIAPPLRWFRGGEADLTQLSDRLFINATINIKRQ